MKHAFALRQRAAEIFGVPEDVIFGGRMSDEAKAAAEAICYVGWLRGTPAVDMEMSFGRFDFHAAMKRCNARRMTDKSYSEKVGALVIADQMGLPPKVEAA